VERFQPVLALVKGLPQGDHQGLSCLVCAAAAPLLWSSAGPCQADGTDRGLVLVRRRPDSRLYREWHGVKRTGRTPRTVAADRATAKGPHLVVPNNGRPSKARCGAHPRRLEGGPDRPISAIVIAAAVPKLSLATTDSMMQASSSSFSALPPGTDAEPGRCRARRQEQGTRLDRPRRPLPRLAPRTAACLASVSSDGA
jgi:hypothetical protein